MLQREQTDYLLINACNAVLAAGSEIMEIYRGDRDFGITLKSDNTPVTAADCKAHDTIKRMLSLTRIPLMSEEGRDMLYEERYMWDLYWLVDPLDGTREYINRNGEFTVNIALMYNNRPYFGVIYVPEREQLFFSDPDRGAFRRDGIRRGEEPLRINELFRGAERLRMEEPAPDRAVLTLTRSHLTDETIEYVERLKKHFPGLQVKHCGSALKFCLLANGDAHLFVRRNLAYDWDVAAGEALVKAAGGVIAHLDGATVAYNKPALTVDPFYASTHLLSLDGYDAN